MEDPIDVPRIRYKGKFSILKIMKVWSEFEECKSKSSF